MKGEFETSLESFENTLNTSLHRYDPGYVKIASLYYRKGITLEVLGRNDEALIAFIAALDIQKKNFSEGHRELAFSLSSIGNRYRIKKDYALARKYYDEALVMQKRILPPDDADSFLPLYHIGLIL